MPQRTKALRAALRQPLLNHIASRNARARELAAAMRLPCTACRAPLASHISTGNRWIGCRRSNGGAL
jgi:hypothetical protein